MVFNKDTIAKDFELISKYHEPLKTFPKVTAICVQRTETFF